MRTHSKFKVLSYEFMVFFTIFVILGFLSYQKAFILDFWADDWTFVYLAKYDMPRYVSKLLYGLHPGELFIALPLIYFYGVDVIVWNVWGFVIKLVSALAAGLAIYGLVQKKTVFYFTALLFVTYYAGIDAFTVMSWRTVPYTLILVCISTFFYGKYFYRNIEKYFWISMFFATIAVAFDPMRIFPFPFILLTWDMGNRYISGSARDVLSWKVLRLAIIATILFLGSLKWFSSTISTPSARLDYIGANSSMWKSFVTGLKTLVTTYGVQASTKSIVVCYLSFCVLGLVLTFLKQRSGPLIVFALLFIPVFYFPNWSFNIGEYPVTFRYFTFSGLGLVFLISYLLSLLRPKALGLVLVLCLVAINVGTSNKLLENSVYDRSIYLTRPYFKKQIEDVPRGEVAGMFYVQGEAGVRSRVFDGTNQGAFPYAIFTETPKLSLVPYSAPSYELAKNAICPAVSGAPPNERYTLTEFPIPLSKIYAWNIEDNGELVDISESFRIQLARDTICQ